MSQNIHIDQYIREKVDTLTFSYEDTYWLDAEKLINDAEKKKKRRFLFWIFFITALSVLAIIFAVLSSPNTKKYTQVKNDNGNSSEKTINTAVVNNKTKTAINQENINNTISVKHKNKFSIIKRKRRADEKVISAIMETDSNDLNSNHQVLSLSNSAYAMDSLAKLNAGLLDAPHEFNLWLSEEEQEKKYKKNRAFVGFSAGPTFNAKLYPAYFASIHVQKILNKKWSVRLSSQAVASSFPYLNYKYTTTDYSFGERITQHEVQSEQLYTLQIPLSIHYRFYKFHSAFIGMGYTRYLAQKNVLTSEYDGDKNNNVEYGISKDIRKDNLNLSFGYETILWRKYQVGLSGSLPMLNPILAKQKINGKTNNIFPEAKVYILYNFIKIR